MAQSKQFKISREGSNLKVEVYISGVLTTTELYAVSSIESVQTVLIPLATQERHEFPVIHKVSIVFNSSLIPDLSFDLENCQTYHPAWTIDSAGLVIAKSDISSILSSTPAKKIKTLTASDFTSNNYVVTSEDMNGYDIIEVDSGGGVTLTFPSLLPVNSEIDVYSLSNEVTPVFTAYVDTASPLSVMNINNTAMTVTVASATKLLVVGVPE